jgi:hypothetical protein
MTKLNSQVDGSHEPAEAKRPWATPQIIESTLASRAGAANPTTTGFPDQHLSIGTVHLNPS